MIRTTTGPADIILNANPLLSLGIRSATIAGPISTNVIAAKPIIARNTMNNGRLLLEPHTARASIKPM
jgi:hypothetical protein